MAGRATVPALPARPAGPTDVDRARRAISFLLGIQLPSGAFPGARIDQNRTAPSVFNTGQILNGLVAWHRATDDPATADAAARAAAWLVSSQEPDGAWSHDVYNRLEVSYLAHATCWLAEYGEHAGDAVAMAAAGRHLDRLLQRYDPATGWFDGAGFSAEDHAARRSVTHTLAYTIWGVLDLGLRLGRAEAVEAASRSAARVAEVVHRDGRLAGMVDASWSALERLGLPHRQLADGADLVPPRAPGRSPPATSMPRTSSSTACAARRTSPAGTPESAAGSPAPTRRGASTCGSCCRTGRRSSPSTRSSRRRGWPRRRGGTG